MPTIADHFPQVETLDIGALHERRNEILATVPDNNFEKLDDLQLAELLAIGRALRKKAAAPGGAGRAKKLPATVDDLI